MTRTIYDLQCSAETSRCLAELANALTREHGIPVKDIKTEVRRDGASGKIVITLDSEIVPETK